MYGFVETCPPLSSATISVTFGGYLELFGDISAADPPSSHPIMLQRSYECTNAEIAQVIPEWNGLGFLVVSCCAVAIHLFPFV
jgi:hypothetical protein